jgi:hypothetical protein
VKRLVLLLVAAALLGSASVAQARPAVEGDWLLIKVESGDQPTADSSAGALLVERASGHGPLLMGLGFVWWFDAKPTSYSTVFTSLNTAGAIEVQSGTAGLSMSQSSPLPSGEVRSSLGGAIPAMPSHATSYLLYFTTNSTFRITKTYPAQGLRTTYIVGRGSRAITFGDNNAGGVAGSAGPAGAAVLAQHTQHPRTGIVGAMSLPPFLFDGLPERISWSGPRVQGSAICAGIVACADDFAGAPGAWTWSWTGARNDLTQTPAVAAYAPVGSAWKAFAVRRQ